MFFLCRHISEGWHTAFFIKFLYVNQLWILMSSQIRRVTHSCFLQVPFHSILTVKTFFGILFFFWIIGHVMIRGSFQNFAWKYKLYKKNLISWWMFQIPCFSKLFLLNMNGVDVLFFFHVKVILSINCTKTVCFQIVNVKWRHIIVYCIYNSKFSFIDIFGISPV